MRSILLLIFLSFVLLPISERAQQNDLKALQKTITSDLFDHTPDVQNVHFDGCRLSLKMTVPLDGTIDPLSGTTPSVMPVDAPYTATVSSRETSRSRNIALFEIDLSQLDPSRVSSAAADKKDRTLITLNASTDSAIRRTSGVKRTYPSKVGLVVSSKSADPILQAFKEIINACHSTNVL